MTTLFGVEPACHRCGDAPRVTTLCARCDRLALPAACIAWFLFWASFGADAQLLWAHVHPTGITGRVFTPQHRR